MKTAFFLLCLCLGTVAYAQVCDSGYVDIRTNPLNPHPLSDTLYTNNWSWMPTNWPVNFDPNPNPDDYMNNPFYSQADVHVPLSFDFPNLDYRWEDGWELIRRDFVYRYNNYLSYHPQNFILNA